VWEALLDVLREVAAELSIGIPAEELAKTSRTQENLR
jgi:hypothetical protein